MRARTLLCVAACVLTLTFLPQASALDIGSIAIVYSQNRLNGVTAGYAVDFEVQGTGITNASFRNVDTSVTTPLTFNAGTGKWEYEASFTSLAAFQSAFPNTTNNYFLFNQSGSSYQDQVLLGYAVTEPADYLHQTSPLMNDTNVALDPTYTWAAGAPSLYSLGQRVRTAAAVPVYSVYPDLAVTTTSWTPGSISPGDYQLVLEDYNIDEGQPLSRSTLNGDAFLYYGLFGQSNQIDFSTQGFSNNVTAPEPTTLLLLGSGLATFFGVRARRRMK